MTTHTLQADHNLSTYTHTPSAILLDLKVHFLTHSAPADPNYCCLKVLGCSGAQS